MSISLSALESKASQYISSLQQAVSAQRSAEIALTSAEETLHLAVAEEHRRFSEQGTQAEGEYQAKDLRPFEQAVDAAREKLRVAKDEVGVWKTRLTTECLDIGRLIGEEQGDINRFANAKSDVAGVQASFEQGRRVKADAVRRLLALQGRINIAMHQALTALNGEGTDSRGKVVVRRPSEKVVTRTDGEKIIAVERPCPKCGGRGKVMTSRPSHPGKELPGFADNSFSGQWEVECSRCKGRGTLDWNRDYLGEYEESARNGRKDQLPRYEAYAAKSSTIAAAVASPPQNSSGHCHQCGCALVQQQKTCSGCHGHKTVTKSQDNFWRYTCASCGNSESVFKGPGLVNKPSHCSRCGKSVAAKLATMSCPYCGGAGTIKRYVCPKCYIPNQYDS